MAFAPLRFLHAADARLDQAIGEIPKLPSRLASIVQDATRAAFDRLIGLATEHEVDFVLLAGNTFVEADKSLAARLALLDAFEQLNRSDIRALVLPGPLDPLDAWRQIPDLPENVTLLEGGPRGVVAVKRDDKVVARVGTELVMPARKKARTLRDELRSASQRAVPFKIGVLASGGELDDATLQDWYPEGQPNVAAFGTNHDARSANSDAAGAGRSGRRRRLRRARRRLGAAHVGPTTRHRPRSRTAARSWSPAVGTTRLHAGHGRSGRHAPLRLSAGGFGPLGAVCRRSAVPL